MCLVNSNNVSVETDAKLHGLVNAGDKIMIGANAAVTTDMPNISLVVGVPVFLKLVGLTYA